MAEGVVDLLEVVEVDEEEGQRCASASRVGAVREEGVEHVEEVAAVAESGELVGLGLAVTLLGEDAQVPRREREADADDHERRRREPEGDPGHAVHVPITRIARPPTAATPGKQEAGGPLCAERIERPGLEPDRHRHEDDRRRPGDGVEVGPDARREDRRDEKRLNVSPMTLSAMPPASRNQGVLRASRRAAPCRR